MYPESSPTYFYARKRFYPTQPFALTPPPSNSSHPTQLFASIPLSNSPSQFCSDTL